MGKLRPTWIPELPESTQLGQRLAPAGPHLKRKRLGSRGLFSMARSMHCSARCSLPCTARVLASWCDFRAWSTITLSSALAPGCLGSSSKALCRS